MRKKKQILFIGDSVTAGHRSWLFPSGFGYVKMISSQLTSEFQVINRGINGDRLIDVERRSSRDFLNKNPEFISIDIGINDVWRRFDSSSPTSDFQFLVSYEKVINQTTKILLNSKIILCEPFFLPHLREHDKWVEDLLGKISVIHFLAKKYSLPVVPFNSHLNGLTEELSWRALAKDGIHPTRLASNVMAELWLSTFMENQIEH